MQDREGAKHWSGDWRKLATAYFRGNKKNGVLHRGKTDYEPMMLGRNNVSTDSCISN